MRKTFQIMGPRANCVKCGAWSRHAEVSACNRCLACSGALDNEFDRRTKMQRHSNYMLFMRRMMKGISSAMRVERWQQWMDNDPSAGEVEPELRNEDLDAYLKAAGHTEESMTAHLAKIQDIVQEAIDRNKEDG